MFLVLPFLRPPLYGLRRNFLCHALCKSYALHEHQKVFLFLRFKFPQKSHDLCCFLLVFSCNHGFHVFNFCHGLFLLSCCVVSQAVNASVVAVTACLTIYYSGYCYLSTLFPFLILTFLAVTAIL